MSVSFATVFVAPSSREVLDTIRRAACDKFGTNMLSELFVRDLDLCVDVGIVLHRLLTTSSFRFLRRLLGFSGGSGLSVRNFIFRISNIADPRWRIIRNETVVS